MLDALHVAKPALVLLALAVWLRRKVLKRDGSAWLAAQLVVAAIVEIVGGYTAIIGARNLWWYDLYVPVEFLLLCGYAVTSTPGLKIPIGFGVLIFLLLYAFDVSRVFPTGFVSVSYALGSFVLAAAFVSGMYRMAIRVDVDLRCVPQFWTYLGMAGFFAGTIPLLGLWNSLVSSNRDVSIALYVINHVLFTFRYGTVAYSALLRHPESINAIHA